MQRAGDNLSCGIAPADPKYGYYRQFSIPEGSLAPGTHTLTVPLALKQVPPVPDIRNGYWEPGCGMPGFDLQTELTNTQSKLQAIGLCFGGGNFACHGVVAPNGGTFQINSYTIQ